MKMEVIAARTTVKRDHIIICSKPAAPRPNTLPVSSCLAETEESRTSITRFSFSSLTPWIKYPDVIIKDIMNMKAKIKGRPKVAKRSSGGSTSPVSLSSLKDTVKRGFCARVMISLLTSPDSRFATRKSSTSSMVTFGNSSSHLVVYLDTAPLSR